MNNIFFVDILQGFCQLPDKVSSLALFKFLLGTFAKSSKELPVLGVLENEIDRKIILEVVVELGDVGVI